MFSRITHYQFDTSRTDEVVAKMGELKQLIQAIPGIKVCLSSWKEDGNGVTVAVYEDQAAAEAAQESVTAVWSTMAEFLTSPPSAEEYESAEDMLG